MRPEQLYLTDIGEAAQAISEFVVGLDEDAFYQDDKTQSAVLQKLIVIGEAAARLPQEFKDQSLPVSGRPKTWPCWRNTAAGGCLVEPANRPRWLSTCRWPVMF